MKKHAASSIRAQILRINLLITAVSVLLALGGSLYFSLRQEKLGLDSNQMNSARILSRVPAVSAALARGEPDPELFPFLDEAIREVSDIDVIAVGGLDSRVYYYPDRSYIGRTYSGSDQARIFAGEAAFSSNDTGVSGAERCAYAEVRSADGALVGFVMVGIYLRSYSRIVLHTVLQSLCIALVAGALGAMLSARLSNRIKRTLLGYEPDAFLALFHQREDILDALEEGVLAVDLAGTVIYVNPAAARMVGLDRAQAAGRPLRQIYPASTLGRVARTGKPEYNVPMSSLGDVRVLSDRMPIRENGAVVGAVGIFRDRTQVTRLAEDLTGVRHMVEAMRSYTHEFMNKLHVILGLLQIGETARAEAYILDVTSIQRRAVGRIMDRIGDPSVAALLVGKTSRCAELGIRLTLDERSHLGREAGFLPPDAYVTLLGNLIENAVEVLNTPIRDPKEITVSIREEEEDLYLCVEDTGPGISAEAMEYIFQKGYSTKGEGRGTGLALVKELVDTYRGEIRAESESGVGTSFFLRFRREPDIYKE